MNYFQLAFIIPGMLLFFIVARKALPVSWEMINRLHQFNQDRRDVSFAGRQEELMLRRAAARLRRKASAEVLKNPANAHHIIARIVDEETMKIAAHDKSAAREFSQWASNAPASEILYTKAFNALFKHSSRKTPQRIDGDLYAALKVRD